MGWLKTLLKVAEVAQHAHETETRRVEKALEAETAYYQSKVAELQVEGARWDAHFDAVTDLLNRARSSYRAGNFAQCEGFCKAAIERMEATGVGNFDYPYERLAILYEKQKRFSDALRYAELGLDLFGRSSSSRERWNHRVLRLKRRIPTTQR